MSAFLKSGRSNLGKTTKMTGSFRPKADIEKPRHEGGARDYRDDHIDSIVIIIVVIVIIIQFELESRDELSGGSRGR